MDGIFKVENDRIGIMQPGVDEIFRLGPRQVESRTTKAIFAECSGRGAASGSHRLQLPEPARRTAASILAPMTNGSAPSSTIVSLPVETPSAAAPASPARGCCRRSRDRLGIQVDLESPFAGLEANEQVTADIFTLPACLAGLRRYFRRRCHVSSILQSGCQFPSRSVLRFTRSSFFGCF